MEWKEMEQKVARNNGMKQQKIIRSMVMITHETNQTKKTAHQTINTIPYQTYNFEMKHIMCVIATHNGTNK
jgi:hypothetical protein